MSAFGFRGAKVDDACERLALRSPVDEKEVLVYPELGMLSLELDSARADEIRKHEAVVQLQPARFITSQPTFSNLSIPRSMSRAFAAEDPPDWNTRLVRAPEAWSLATGKGVKVGIIDSGISRQHPDLLVVDGASFYPGIDDWDDTEDGHGTQCAGIVGARRNDFGVTGVAPESDLYALKISRGGSSNTDLMIAAMLWAARKKLDVVSISLWNQAGETDPYAPVWEDVDRAAQFLINNGCLVVGIAGNSGYYPNHWVTNPARGPGFIAVGGVRQDKSRYAGSSYGPADLAELQAVEIVAPGQDVWSTSRTGGYIGGTGTSFACPHVTGAVALLKQRYPFWTPDEIRGWLKSTAADLGAEGRDEQFGAGLLDCFEALNRTPPEVEVVKQVVGRVTGLSREGDTILLLFEAGARVRNGDWQDFPVIRLLLNNGIRSELLPLLTQSIGRSADIFGFFRHDRQDRSKVHADDLSSITLRE